MTKRSKHRFLLADSLILIACVTLSTNVRKFSLRFQGTNIFNSLSSEIQNTSSAAKHTLALLMLVCSFSLSFFSFILALFFLTFSFSFLHLHVQTFLFLSYLMIIFYVPNKLCVF